MSDQERSPATSSTTPNTDLPEISPDFVEHDFPATIDNAIPTRGYSMIPLIGLGIGRQHPGVAKFFFCHAAR
ncbi:MAG: hypothetical protein JWL90_1089 [Chthoniobacteraceae bacterium]|nr:hypothetical protein [Chthoniobacteraceae bacterium]